SYFFFQAEDGIRDFHVTGVQTCALPISPDAGPDTSLPADGLYRAGQPAAWSTASYRPPAPELHVLPAGSSDTARSHLRQSPNAERKAEHGYRRWRWSGTPAPLRLASG